MAWMETQVYNTIMAVSVGVSLILLVCFFNKLRTNKLEYIEGWIVGFIIPGIILSITGIHMTLTWPISKLGLPFDDIIFGEPSFAFGIMLIVFSWLLRHKYKLSLKEGNPNSSEFYEQLKVDLPRILSPMSLFAAAMGLALIAIAIAGVTYQLFAAPAEEPISGLFADYPIVEATFVSSLYAFIGIGAIAFYFYVRNTANELAFKFVKNSWLIAGVIFTLFGIMNYFTHIGLIVNILKLKGMM